MEKYENIIIGFGKGGKTLAKTLAAKGQSVLVIEKSQRMYGGTCINIGCIPSKSLILNGEKKMDFVTAVEHKEKLTKMLRNKNYHMIADEATGVVLDGTARFISDHILEVALPDGTKMQVEGEKIFINTGALPIILPINTCLIPPAQWIRKITRNIGHYWGWLYWFRVCFNVC